jgi:hypothetical protein
MALTDGLRDNNILDTQGRYSEAKPMLKALVLCAVAILATSFYVSREDQRFADQHQHQSQTSAALDAGQHPQSDQDDLDGNPPNWHVYFSWPYGVTAWMVILTLVAVSWQANQTKRAADAALAQAKIQTKTLTLQFRPRLRVRRIFTDGGNVPQSVTVLIANVGSSDAHIIGGKAVVYNKANWDEGSGDELAGLEIYPSVVKPGEELTVAVITIDDHAKFAWAVTSSNSADLVRCQGNIRYADDAGVIRKTSFSRNYKRSTTNFTDIAYLEDEYED